MSTTCIVVTNYALASAIDFFRLFRNTFLNIDIFIDPTHVRSYSGINSRKLTFAASDTPTDDTYLLPSTVADH